MGGGLGKEGAPHGSESSVHRASPTGNVPPGSDLGGCKGMVLRGTAGRVSLAPGATPAVPFPKLPRRQSVPKQRLPRRRSLPCGEPGGGRIDGAGSISPVAALLGLGYVLVGWSSGGFAVPASSALSSSPFSSAGHAGGPLNAVGEQARGEHPPREHLPLDDPLWGAWGERVPALGSLGRALWVHDAEDIKLPLRG